jgi:hypothetical protein
MTTTLVVPVSHAVAVKNPDGTYSVEVTHAQGNVTTVNFPNIAFAHAMAESYAGFLNGFYKVESLVPELTAVAKTDAAKVADAAKSDTEVFKADAEALKAKAETVLVAAKAEGKKILAEAKAEALRLIAEAKAEIAKLRAKPVMPAPTPTPVTTPVTPAPVTPVAKTEEEDF